MKKVPVFTASLVLALAAATVGPDAQAPAPRTVWDGVYTEAQATRAQGTFGASCERCHTLTPDGRRPLSGDAFLTRHTQKTVGELLTYISTSMPNGQPGTLSPSNYNDLMALILRSNGVPAGTTELTPETIAKVMIVPKGGGGALPANALARVVGCLGPKSGADWTLTSATAPERANDTKPGPDDATRALGDGKVALKFVLSRLDAHVGKRVSVSGLLLGAGGADGINVSTVSPVADTCP
jgi:S-disulfanyl-L-cysteine oxidoreductase SoxD